MRILDFIATGGFVAVLITLPFFLCNLIRHLFSYGSVRFPIRSLLFFVTAIAISFAVDHISRKVTQATVLFELETLTDKYRVYVDGAPASNPNEVVLALKALRWLPYHHSSPSKRIAVEILDESHRIVIWMKRDSSNPREYWVFDPRNGITRSNEIGKIITPAFDNYSK